MFFPYSHIFFSSLVLFTCHLYLITSPFPFRSFSFSSIISQTILMASYILSLPFIFSSHDAPSHLFSFPLLFSWCPFTSLLFSSSLLMMPLHISSLFPLSYLLLPLLYSSSLLFSSNILSSLVSSTLPFFSSLVRSSSQFSNCFKSVFKEPKWRRRCTWIWRRWGADVQ